MTGRTNRFQSFTPLRNASPLGLRRLKTAFSPTRSQRSVSPSSSTDTTSPLTRTASPDSTWRHSNGSSSAASIRQMLALRRQPSVLEFEMEEERHLFAQELDMLEPRPYLGGGVEASIFEVLDGKQ